VDVSTTSFSPDAVSLSTADFFSAFLVVATSVLDAVAVLAVADFDAGAASEVSSSLISSCASLLLTAEAESGRTSRMFFCGFGLLRDALPRAFAVFFGIVSLSLARLPRKIHRASWANYCWLFHYITAPLRFLTSK